MAVKYITYTNKDFDINYEILNPTNKKSIVFLHGWGSNKEIMKQAFGKYLPSYKHIYIDMPGFGKSHNNYILTTQDYTNIIKIFLQEFNIDDEYIVLGHSFGGKVATLLNPKNLVLLSSAGIVERKTLKTQLVIKIAKIFNKIGLKKLTNLLRSSDVKMMDENMYETFKNVVDEDFSEEFLNYKNDALIFWGDKDKATKLESGKKIHNLIENSKLIVYSGDHYFFLKYTDDIAKLIIKDM